MEAVSKNRNVALVLSSGGARGLAQIGVIDELQARGYTITSVAGSSMGALVGGLFAAGKLGDFKEWVLGLDKLEVISLIDFTITTKGFVKGEKVFTRMQKLNLVPDVNIEDLPIPYVALAVDISNNNECVFRSGSLLKAIRASIAIPSVFTPASLERSLLVDGGVLNPLPVEFIVRKPTDLLVAVDLNALIPYEKPKLNKSSEGKDRYNEKVTALIQKWDELFGHGQPAKPDKNVKRSQKQRIGYFDLLLRSVQLMQSKLTQYALEANPPDVVIPISKDASTVFEFYKGEELIEYGRRMCVKMLDSKGL